MAEFSKQYLELANWKDFPYDFDIDEVYNSLEKGFYRSIICEGFGFWAIGKDNEGEKIVYIRNFETGEDQWVNYETFVDDFKLKKAQQVDSISMFNNYPDDISFNNL